MQSHWEKLPTIRVVDAGYLLAGMEPERKWQFAPPLVANLFNLIREKTGAVKCATMLGERMEITQMEYQTLKAEYGVTPVPIQNAATTAPVVIGGKKWTPEKLTEMKAYREVHTMPETAVKFDISEQRIRSLLPSQKPKAKPFAGLIHRMK